MRVIIEREFALSEADNKKLTDLGYTVLYYEDLDDKEAEVYVGRTKADTSDIRGLKFIQTATAGFDQLDLNKLQDKGIALANARDVYSIPISEYVIGKILAFYKEDRLFMQQQSKNLWKRDYVLKELTDQTIVIFGTGSIGQEIAKRIKHFNVKVVGVNTTGHNVENFIKCYPLEKMNEALSIGDIVVCALPLNDSTKNLFTKEVFLKMKSDAMFINIGRGPSVNENDLLAVLDNHLAQVVLDVVETEPLSSDSPLWSHPKIVITPHLSFSSNYTNKRLKELFMTNLINYIEGKDIVNQII